MIVRRTTSTVLLSPQKCKGLFSFSFASSFQSTGSAEYGVSAITEVERHVLRDSIPLSVWFVRVFRDTSFSTPCPRKDQCRARIFSHDLPQLVNSQYIFLRFPPLPIQCRCTLSWRLFVLGIAQDFQSSCFGLRRGSAMWWILGKSSTRIPSVPRVNSIQFSTLRWIHKPITFLLPYCYGSITDSSHAQYRIREYVDFRCWKPNCSVHQQSRPFPRCFLPVDQGYSLDFCLFADQLPGYIEQMFHCSLWLIFGWI